MVDIVRRKMSDKEIAKKYKLSSSQVSSMKTRMKSISGVLSMLHCKWQDKQFLWKPDMAA